MKTRVFIAKGRYKMLKSKIFLKAMFIVASVIIAYTLVISLFAIPKIDQSIQTLEEKNAKEVLNRVVTITRNVSNDLESFKKRSLQIHKNELKNLTDTVWSIIQTKYEQSKPENLHTVLKQRGEMFKKNLMHFYNSNRGSMSMPALKDAIKNYTKIYRHDSLNTGYFWINDFNGTMIMHPIQANLDGKNLLHYSDPNGVYLFADIVRTCQERGAGIVKYQWENPNTGIIEDKISYVFTFEPFGWIFGTGEYYSVLKTKFQKEVIDLVSKLRYGKNNYFYITDYNNVLISHPYLQGSDLSQVKDVKGNYILQPMIKIAREKGEGFHRYWWKKNGSDNTPYEKLTYAKDFPDWKMVIGTGVYIDDIEKEVSKRKKELMAQLQTIIKNTHIGKTGYLYIFDDKGNMLIHPNSNINGKNFSRLENPSKGTYIFDDLIKASRGSKELFYKWDKPSDKGHYVYDKVSWIEYVPELGWYIVSSAYVDEFKTSSIEVRHFILILAVTIFILSALYSFVFLRNLLVPITDLSHLALKVTGGDYRVRSDLRRDDEIGVLAGEFNRMVETIEDHIENLDQKVQEKTQELKHLSDTDPMTGLWNRRYFTATANTIWSLAQRDQTELSVIMLDIDWFKQVNDTYGHHTGDEVIVALAQVLKDSVRQSDLICRFGGEEFILLLPETSLEGAVVIAEKIRKTIEEMRIVTETGDPVHFTVSVGVSQMDPQHDPDIETTIRRADEALYRAKESGRNRTVSHKGSSTE